ncbi:hypothetical protein DB347_04655 [Opitutaceae bacterium EW11]|nr:hypothetical protein DB347_04655 [Opitutaceae bacterium EW11]
MTRFQYLRRMIFDGRGRPPAPAARPDPSTWADDAVTGSCLGHSTVLANFFGAWLLTDPVFSLRVGPGIPPFVLGPKRYLQPALRPRDFPAPDAIVISHAHFDHFDTWSLLRFRWKTPIVTPRNTAGLLQRRGFRNVHELHWGESMELSVSGRPLRFTAVEVAHWGARTLRDHHRGYNGYVIERDGRSLCFAGDTAYTTAFAQLAERPRPLDLMIMPIGAYNPWIRAHCDPEQAAAMARMAGARCFVPVHHQTFRLSSEPMDEPAARIRAAFATEPERLLAVNVGETFRVPLR